MLILLGRIVDGYALLNERVETDVFLRSLRRELQSAVETVYGEPIAMRGRR